MQEKQISRSRSATTRRGGFAGVTIPGGFRHHPPAVRDRLIADSLYLATRQLSQFLGWDDLALERAIARVEADRFECAWTSPWKSTRDQRRHVRLRGAIEEDGYARFHLELAAHDSDQVIARTEQILGWTWIENLQRTAKSMKWSTPTTISMDNRGAALTVDIDTMTVQRPMRDRVPRQISSTPELAPPVPGVVLQGYRQQIWIGSGGPMSRKTSAYVDAAEVYHERMRARPDWVEWFAQLEIDEFRADLYLDAKDDKVLVRLVDRRLTATRHRTDANLPGRRDADRVARADLERLLDRVVTRLGAPPHPSLD